MPNRAGEAKTRNGILRGAVSRFAFLVGCGLLFSPTATAKEYVQGLNFSTWGNERYADGSLVMPGECYALVWHTNTLKITDFKLPANPPVAMSDLESLKNGFLVMRYYPVAVVEGDYAYCPEQMIACGAITDLWLAKSGYWSLVILDTRYQNEKGETVCGFEYDPNDQSKNRPKVINGWQPVFGLTDVYLETKDLPMAMPSFVKTVEGDVIYDKTGVPIDLSDTVVSIQSALPADAPKPVICDFRLEAGVAKITVTNAPAYVAYNLAVSDDVKALATKTDWCAADFGAVKPLFGKGAAPISWELPADGEKGFYRLVRQPLK